MPDLYVDADGKKWERIVVSVPTGTLVREFKTNAGERIVIERSVAEPSKAEKMADECEARAKAHAHGFCGSVPSGLNCPDALCQAAALLRRLDAELKKLKGEA